MINKITLIFSCLCLIVPLQVSCEKNNITGGGEQMMEVSFEASQLTGTKTIYDVNNHVGLWKREDIVGVVASFGNNAFTDAYMQPFSVKNRNQSGTEFLSNAIFSGKLTDKGYKTYTYYAVYPYTAFVSTSNLSAVSSRLEERQFPELNSWDGSCDMLASKPITVISQSVATNNIKMEFTRLFGMLRLSFGPTIIKTYGSEIVETISIESATDTDQLAGKFTVDLSSTEVPDPVMSSKTDEYFNKITLDYRGRNALLSEITAFFILNPGTYSNVIITIKTKNHSLSFDRTGLIINRNCFSFAILNWKTGDNETISSPLIPVNPDTLRVFTFGHSYVLDSMAYIDELLNDAGITKATFANFHIPDCSLQTYWSHVNNKENKIGGSDKISYYKRYFDKTAVIESSSSKTVIEALCDERWDVVVFQTDLQHLGRYEYFASYLQNMINYVKNTCQEKHKKVPVFAWHMFWPYGSHSYLLNSYYDGSQELNYAAHVQSAKKIMRNMDIQLVIPTGTTVQSMRKSSLNNPYDGTDIYEFMWDGKGWSHMDNMAGRYSVACTWFEFFIKPCFGTSVLGNKYMPPTTYTGVPVTSENREQIQRAAVLACKSPFEISHLDEILPYSDVEVSGSTEGFTNTFSGDFITESFDFIDNLDW